MRPLAPRAGGVQTLHAPVKPFLIVAVAAMVRRAERALGVAIRKGEEAGEISRRGQDGGTRFPPGANRPRADYEMSVPSDFARNDELNKCRHQPRRPSEGGSHSRHPSELSGSATAF